VPPGKCRDNTSSTPWTPSFQIFSIHYSSVILRFDAITSKHRQQRRINYTPLII
jgi:hypothetical protein